MNEIGEKKGIRLVRALHKRIFFWHVLRDSFNTFLFGIDFLNLHNHLNLWPKFFFKIPVGASQNAFYIYLMLTTHLIIFKSENSPISYLRSLMIAFLINTIRIRLF